MRRYLLAGAAAISVAMMPTTLMAQANVAGSTNTVDDKRSDYEMTSEQQAMHDAWTAEQQADYATWPYDYRVYYWSLDPAQQEGYWVLTPDQRVQIYTMVPERRIEAWNSVLAQINGSSATTAPKTTRYVSNEVVEGNRTPQPQAEYPVCKGAVQDSCINPRAAGLSWGNRPLDHWPGKPASDL
ncbi:MAG: hypothetical protein KDE21_14075 [Novosphingobium sp.]|nr:hypothetical protein [Novosphingobium sp.]